MKSSRLVVADTALFKTDWLGIYQVDGDSDYTYVHEEKAYKGEKVGLLPFRYDNYGRTQYLAVKEQCSPRSEDQLICAITGKVDDGETVSETAVRELEEEAGYAAVYFDDLIPLGLFYPSKSMDTQIHCYAVHVEDCLRVEATGDGSEEEEEMSRVWLYKWELVHSYDPLLSAMALALDYTDEHRPEEFLL